MFRLQLPTDPRWVNIVETNIEEILTDHAWCEQKAATNAITIITQNSDYPDLVADMLALAKEEIEHFQMVNNIIVARGLKLGRERKDPYVNELAQYMKRSNTGSRISGLVERMLFGAMIEARSCERFKVLSENIKDPELAVFYRDLMESEAGHYTTFIKYARKYGHGIDVEKRWNEWLEFEASVIANYGKSETVHG
ncbi:tRNA 2-methylthio-N6-isopentenyl adenosine(37) hydroxylase MiaE [Flavobacterium branchiophilum NBRC 15030 = ATCC 35035]|uniref:tRNA-(MS[2]IO[6]A)-hydroxylase n=2 Tax=Flavobacterium branchiophilum TaxID=55197 RepID=G2Z758_FLABF|nr:tRNA-(ms[2]io[6]A)-hydroxylase [Flavobacterium branchiophilum]OXA75107.1 tRNA 2-methylthio-N6-isopentenyl adenosine(37) hydroxylase MiaE [Flavobacterium branchiophilum NBRC 15030 = ATCC 35035]PDS22985.1 tRNA 2-methylthio-N6-isopentenyl adenosine(37) hydroxylase MiaE [Flavobacterium branchiophilum]TQM39606.1 tRNA-(ms[2]io[6]A)-hydroxylase [Flavobacterium branchiophilum]CCB69089.1 tRNA-(MS[2]IO[6]A)-hydroxylase [Flavobacterium branchiophilum FL-15]GEM56482.1 tRNA 2-methylthio-N6-isopentenyl a